jgi:hypothetical protein
MAFHLPGSKPASKGIAGSACYYPPTYFQHHAASSSSSQQNPSSSHGLLLRATPDSDDLLLEEIAVVANADPGHVTYGSGSLAANGPRMVPGKSQHESLFEYSLFTQSIHSNQNLNKTST